MAAKKKALGPPVDVPSFVLEDDGNKAVARAKAALAKKWSLTRAETLADVARLAWFLAALGRDKEAREIAEHVAERVSFTGDRDAWSSASQSIALAARLARIRGDEALRKSLVARLVEHPAVAIAPPEALARSLAEPGKDLRSAEVEPSAKYALEGFARGCARATYLHETASEIAYPPGSVDAAALARTIDEGLEGLRAHLAR